MSNNTVASAVKSLMIKEPFYGYLLLGLNKEFNDILPTAGVSKKGIDVQLTINPTFWAEIDVASRIGVLKHEMLHIGFGHLFLQDILTDHSLLNIAADLEVNQYINEDQKGPSWRKLGPIEIANFPELNLPLKAGTIKYYELLKPVLQKRQQQQKQQGQGPGQGGEGEENEGQDGQGQGQGKKQSQNQGQGSGSGPGSDPSQTKGKGKGGTDPVDSKIWDYYDDKNSQAQANHKLWKDFMDGIGEAEKKLIKKQIEHNIKKLSEEVKRSRGNIPAEMKEIVDNLFVIEEPVIDWKQYVRRFAGSSNKVYTKKTRYKANKRFSDNPALKIKRKKHILVARDTSGSTSKKDHEEFFNELHHMYKTGVKISIIDCDADVADLFEYKGVPPDHMSGRGGTDFDPAIIYYNDNLKKYDNFIYLTDGECPAPRTKCRTIMLWVISSGGTLAYSKDYPGKVVQIS